MNQKFIGLDNRGYETGEPTQFVEVQDEPTMNQIPNIEETHNTREVEDIVDELYSLAWQDGSEGLNRRSALNERFQSEVHHHLQKARTEERKIIKLRIDYDRRKGIPAEETVNDIYDSIELKDHSELDQDKQ